MPPDRPHVHRVQRVHNKKKYWPKTIKDKTNLPFFKSLLIYLGSCEWFKHGFANTPGVTTYHQLSSFLWYIRQIVCTKL